MWCSVNTAGQKHVKHRILYDNFKKSSRTQKWGKGGKREVIKSQHNSMWNQMFSCIKVNEDRKIMLMQLWHHITHLHVTPNLSVTYCTQILHHIRFSSIHCEINRLGEYYILYFYRTQGITSLAYFDYLPEFRVPSAGMFWAFFWKLWRMLKFGWSFKERKFRPWYVLLYKTH